MLAFIKDHENYFELIKDENLESHAAYHKLIDIKLLTPLPNPSSVCDFLGFEQHMLNASKAFGHKIGEVYYQIPVFYFTNHHAIFGPDDEIKRPKNETNMDLV